MKLPPGVPQFRKRGLQMSWTFSKRCRNVLQSQKLTVSIPRSVRRRIWMLMNDFNEQFRTADIGGFLSWTSRLNELKAHLFRELGIDALYAYPEEGDAPPEPSDMESFVLRGNVPPYVFDALELYYAQLRDEEQSRFQRRFNDIMSESDLAWRMAEGRIFPVDSVYMEEEIAARCLELLDTVGFEGALREFRQARVELVNGDTKEAVRNANLAVESVLKGVLSVERMTPGKLFRQVVDTGLFPVYFEGFLKAFEDILRGVAVIRNEELGVGHGQGKSVNEVPQELAEMAVNLAGVLIKYVIERYLREDGELAKRV
jgi:hypothetical protein